MCDYKFCRQFFCENASSAGATVEKYPRDSDSSYRSRRRFKSPKWASLWRRCKKKNDFNSINLLLCSIKHTNSPTYQKIPSWSVHLLVSTVLRMTFCLPNPYLKTSNPASHFVELLLLPGDTYIKWKHFSSWFQKWVGRPKSGRGSGDPALFNSRPPRLAFRLKARWKKERGDGRDSEWFGTHENQSSQCSHWDTFESLRI